MKLSWYSSNWLLVKIFMMQLVNVVQRTPNLVRFSLVMMSHGPDDINLATMLKLLHKMPKLEFVEIDLPYWTRLVPIKHHFLLFARLKELKIGGDWYRGVKTLGSAPDKITPWNLKHLTIDRLDMSFFHYCPNLEKLSLDLTGFSFGAPKNNPVIKRFMEQLRQLAKLKIIAFEENNYHPEYDFKIQQEKNRIWCRSMGADIRCCREKLVSGPITAHDVK